jgi:hypothetical protein
MVGEVTKGAFSIVFRGKVQSCMYTDGTLASRYIRVPTLTRSHVPDMGSARGSRKYGGYANSDLFPSMLRRAAVDAGCKPRGDGLVVDLLNPSPGVEVDESGFLATVTIRVPDAA